MAAAIGCDNLPIGLADAGYRLGRSNGVDVWASVEDSILIVGPPRSGKGLHLVINMILDAPGAVVTTSTRADSLAVTLRARQRVGPVSVFDPQNLAGLAAGLRWSPVRGCETPRTAMVRANALAAATGLGAKNVSDRNFSQDQTKAALQALLHAAALGGASIDRLYRWSLDPVAAEDAIDVLRDDPRAAQGWEDALDAAVHADARTRDSIWLGVRQALAALADPTVRAAVDPGGHDGFDPEAFLRERSTLFLLGTSTGVNATAVLLAAMVEDITETARRLAARSVGARLDPPLALVLDEIANLSPLPSLPTLMADGGGTGITPIVVLQSLSQARSKWGSDQAGAIWDAAIAKIILGGGSNARDLKELSDLIGQRDERTVSVVTASTGGDPRRSISVGSKFSPRTRSARCPSASGSCCCVRPGRSSPTWHRGPLGPTRGASVVINDASRTRFVRPLRSRARRTPTRDIARFRYAGYIKSDAWRRTRHAWVTEWHKRNSGEVLCCAVCGRRWAERRGDLHHRTYARLGHERFEDLVPLCRTCHTFVHGLIDASPTLRQMHRSATTVVSDDPLAGRRVVSTGTWPK